MPIRVKLPTGEIGEFPDSMSQEDIEAVLQKQFPPESADTSLAQPEPKPEQTGFKGIASDTIGMLQNALKTGRGFLKDLPQMTEDLGQELLDHPATGQIRGIAEIGASTAELGKSAVNSPHDLFKYLLKKNLAIDIPIPGTKLHTSDLLPHIPEDTGLEKFLGLKPRKGDRLLRAILDIATTATGGAGLIKSGKKLFKGPDLKQALRDTQAKVNKATKNAGDIFNYVENEAISRGINKVPVKEDLLEKARDLLSNTLANKKLIEKAKSGDYEALRKVQSDLRTKADKGLASDNLADNDLADEILDVRDEINGSIQSHFENTGNKDLAEALNKARTQYRDIKKIYQSTPRLAKTFGDSQLVPDKPITLLREESTQMKKFMEANPELEKALVKALKHEKNKKRALIGLGVLGGGTTAGITSHFLGK